MIARRFIQVVVMVLVFSIASLAQVQQTGTSDYALANSSVMWLPRSSSLFLNPGELAGLHQNEFLVSSGRFQTLASMSGSLFLSNVGTLAFGAVPVENSTILSAGFGHLIGNYSNVGASISLIPKVQNGFRFSFGGTLHLPGSSRESGLHAGLSMVGLPTNTVLNAGAGYWLFPHDLRLQLATRTGTPAAEYLGAEVRIAQGWHVQAGTRGFRKVLGGVSYTTSYATLELGGGPEGLSFTMNVRIGDAASDVHDEAYDEADKAFADGRYGDAKDSFLKALEFDEYDENSRLLAARAQFLMDSAVTALLRQARENEAQQKYSEAMRQYAQILKIDPQQSTASSRLADVQEKIKLYVGQLLAAGDSLKNRNDLTRARKSYELAQELDPENDSVSVRLDQLEDLSKENVRLILSRARSLLRKNQLDEAEREFQRVIAVDPENSQARSGLHTVNARMLERDVTRGKDAYGNGKFFDALQIFADIIKKDPNNREAKDWLEKSREALKSEADKLFKTGLQFYIKEDFKSAIAAWDKVLMIMPSDSSTLEYRKRAEEKLKALEQFQ